MKRIILTTLFTILILPMFYIVINAAPTNYDVFSCDINANSFTVDVLSVVDGTVKYDSKACFTESQYGAAVTKMNELVSQGNKNVVIRYLKSDETDFYSPLKIVAASRAMAYTQNETYSSQETLHIHSLVSLNSTVNYIDSNEPLVYYETNVSDQGSGVFKPSNLVAYIQINGQSGYVPLKMIDIIPFIYVENKILTPYLVRKSEGSTEFIIYKRVGRDPGIIPEPVSYTVSNGEISIYIDRAISGSTILYAKAPSWLPNGKYYSPNGINFYTDLDLKNPVKVDDAIGEYYSYYNYLNFRSKSNYTGTELNSFLSNYFSSRSIDPNSSVITNQGDVFINSQNTYGMNGLLFYAFAIHESDFGRSTIATTKLNLFGYGAYDSNTSNAATYTSVKEGVERHMGIQMRFYLDYLNNNRFYSSNLGNKGVGLNTKYASDPYWNVKIAAHAYRIDKALGFKDQDAYQIAILSETDRSLYKERELTSSLVTVSTRAKNYPVILNNIKNDVYQINTSNPIIIGNMVLSSNTSLIPYSFEDSVAYIPKAQVKLVNIAKNPVLVLDPPPLENDVTMNLITHLNWNGDLLEIKGASALKNTNMGLNTTTHTLSIISNIDPSIVFEFALETDTPLYPINLNNGYDYTSAWFKGTVDIKDIPEGFYKFVITTKSGITTGRFDMINTPTTPMPTVKTIGDYDYKFVFNNFKRMSYELIKEKGILTDQQSPTLFSRFPSFSMITEFSISESDSIKLLSISGAALMQHINQGPNDSVVHKLMFVDSNGNQTIYDLNTINGTSSMITDKNFDYTSTSFSGENIDISGLEPENYRIYVIVQNTNYTDVVELKNNAFISETDFNTSDKTYSLKINNLLRKRFELNIVKID